MVTVQLYLEPVQLIGVSSSHVAVISFGHEISARRMNNVKNLHLEFKLTVKRKTKQPKNRFLKLKKCMIEIIPQHRFIGKCIDFDQIIWSRTRIDFCLGNFRMNYNLFSKETEKYQ